MAGDDLKFSGTLQTATCNDLPAGTSFASIEFAGNDFAIAGNNFAIANKVVVDPGVTGSTISADLALDGAVKFDVAGNSLIDSGNISGSGSLAKYGNGTLTLEGADSYGSTTVLAGVLLTGSLGSALAVGSNSQVEQNTTYTVNLLSTDTLSAWSIGWGDGSTDSWAGDSSTATHTYTGTPERYTVTATGTDCAGATGIATFPVLVLPTLPQPAADQSGGGQDDTDSTGAQDVVVGQTAQDQQSQQQTGTVAISGASRVNAGGPYLLNLPIVDSNGSTVASWSVTWGDSSQPQTVSGGTTSVTHVYSATGPYAISATATLGDGMQETTGGTAGLLDPGFNGGSAVQVNGDGLPASVAVDPNGDLAVLTSGQLALYESNGTALDPAFNSGSPISTGLGNAWGPHQVAVQPDGKVLVTGDTWVFDNATGYYMQEFAVKRYNANGTPDTTFGNDGLATVPVFNQNGEQDTPTALLLEPDGDIVVAGYAQNPNTCCYNFAVVRLNPDGTPDTGFNGTGTAAAFPSGWAYSAALRARRGRGSCRGVQLPGRARPLQRRRFPRHEL